MSFKPGDSLLHFRLVEKIGEGGMGVVWKATDSKLDREVAVKILSPDFAADSERLARFGREARTLAALSHPNIITIHSVEEAQGVHFFTMELVRGKSLRELVPVGGLTPERFFDLAIPIVRAVGAAHEGRVTHRDLKTRNIMVSDKGVVKVLDFGLAQVQKPTGDPEDSDASTTTVTSEGRMSGTIPYMSPEQIQGKPLDTRSDIFSLGTILYEMATGRRPFGGETAADVAASILRDSPTPIPELKPAMPRQLDRIIRHSLEKNPRRRFQTALDLRNELEALRAELEAPSPAAGAGEADLGSVAVLPLDNLSGDPEQEFFADGMTDALINDLAKIGAMKVISRTSVMQYKGVKRPLPQIAKELGVGAIVEGSVVRAGNRVRITAQLIRAAGEKSLWADSYDRDLGDVLTLQAEVAQAIADGIQVKLTRRERDLLAGRGEVDPEAHEACLRGRHFWHMRTPATVKKGLECFEHAIEIAPDYAPAHAGVADSYIVDGGRYLSVPPHVAYTRARAAALRALALDDDLAEAHTSLAAVFTDFDWSWAGAEAEYRRAIELNPGYVTAHSWFAEHLSRMGRHDEAIAEARLAQDLDPLSLISNVIVAWILYFARHHDEAIEWARKTMELDPNYAAAHRILGWAYEETGKYGEAIAAHRKAADLSDNSPNYRGQLGRAYALAGRRDDTVAILNELVELSERTPISSFDIALIHTALGNPDRAFEWLTRAVEEHSDHMPYLMVNPRVDPLRSDPRFKDLARRLALPVEARAAG